MKHEQEAHSVQTMLSEVIDSLPDAILAIDKDGKVITWNQAMEKMTGARAMALGGRFWSTWC
jgi:PAS domain S-box-containing protein